MTKTEILIAILGGGFLIYLIWEAFRVRADRKKLRHVIYVNGTRGKSTVTRMIAAGLTAGGHRVLCKTTGTLPIAIHPDGRQEEIRRRGPANIREQMKYLHIAAREGADCLVIECMALQPEYQRVSGRNMLRCDIGVITNARLDHGDVMGETREEVLSCLMEMLPEKGRIFTAEQDFRAVFEARAEKLGSRLDVVGPRAMEALPEEMRRLDFPDNTALALAVFEAVGVDRETACEGMRHFVRDPYALSVFKGGETVFVNALSANDVSSTRQICGRLRGGAEEELVLLINNRADRPARARDMVRLAKELGPRQIWLLGEGQPALKALCGRAVRDARIVRFRKAEEIPLFSESPRLILAAGNIKNEGMRLVERARQEMVCTEGVGCVQ